MRAAPVRRGWRAAALLAAALFARGGFAQDALGLCPGDDRPVDAYLRALCEAESALRAGSPREAVRLFTKAAATPRIDAAHELAWAGLAVAHCQAGDFAAGRQWAAHFAQARQLWVGELDCASAAGEPRGRIDPFVRSRMCGETMVADYALVRGQPEAAHTIELKQRLAGLESAIGRRCAAASGTRPAVERAQAVKKAKAARKKARRAPAARPSGTRASPDRGR